MKKCELTHKNGFVLVNDTGDIVLSSVDVGDIEGDIDWDLVESQANELGYSLFA